ncbi:MAG: malate dehydrogenase (quinone) [Pseudomonas sp.]|jgi:malate dehydrogenase (quinone)|nr:malate dehydrogenase (quinone) [Pseudomonas sp.]MDD2222926.1 malate dehydrogenase (quinone) [Pseudomonas sp.]MDY0414732.1 malate dehydrogenase (quinone) [Pseudomonas sp.]NLO53785.1 malate dehydrogenase (quinone) [Gammaproteobacteria bacterium]
MAQENQAHLDVLLVGAGIMSSTLAVMLKELDPSLRLEIVEQMEDGAMESSNPWNNAGTGHAGLCELNYTPQAADGSIDIKKAININAMFEESKQFWAHLVETGTFGDPASFIHPVPHLSFVEGKDNVAFLEKRAQLLKAHHAFAQMEFTTDKSLMAQWLPLMMAERKDAEEIALTCIRNGTDVNFGALTRQLLSYLDQQDNSTLSYKHRVVGLERCAQGWQVTIKNLVNGQRRIVTSRFVFLGAGGAALPLLQKSGIPEGKGYGGFPVSGQWLRCDNPKVVEQHQAKVYSLAAVGSPPMSVPHLDTRVIDGKKSLLFGPYAGFTTKFLKHGSFLDLPLSVRFSNIGPMLAVGRDNMDLTRYLVSEVMQSMEQRLDSLRRFYPQLDPADWKLEIAGQRVQIIKKDAKKGGILQFGTELVSSADGSLAALLGASPGASVTVSIMLDLLKRCFPEQSASSEWTEKLSAIFPAPLKELETNAELYRSTQDRSDQLLKLR